MIIDDRRGDASADRVYNHRQHSYLQRPAAGRAGSRGVSGCIVFREISTESFPWLPRMPLLVPIHVDGGDVHSLP
jgi:hypothetical protein